MKNKTLTLLLPLILFASFFTACTKNIKDELASKEIISAAPSALTIDDINFEDLDKSISKSVLATKERLIETELSTEGHLLLGAEFDNNQLTTYIIAGVSNYGFVNDVFTSINATGAIPTIITYEVNPNNNRYTEISYLEPKSDLSFKDGVISIFPENYIDEALDADTKYPKIEAMQLKQANEYLDFIDRNVEIKSYVETVPLKSALEKDKFKELLPSFPFFEGSIEAFDNDIRYKYSSNHIDTETIICTKESMDGKIVAKFSLSSNGDLTNILNK